MSIRSTLVNCGRQNFGELCHYVIVILLATRFGAFLTQVWLGFKIVVLLEMCFLNKELLYRTNQHKANQYKAHVMNQF